MTIIHPILVPLLLDHLHQVSLRFRSGLVASLLFLTIQSLRFSILQMFVLFLANYCVLHTLVGSLLFALLDRHEALDSLDFASYTFYSDIFAFRSGFPIPYDLFTPAMRTTHYSGDHVAFRLFNNFFPYFTRTFSSLPLPKFLTICLPQLTKAIKKQFLVRNFIPFDIKIVADQVFPVRNFISPEIHL